MPVPRGLSGEEFVGYTFRGSPERRSRLWFLDRHIAILLVHACGWTVSQHEITGSKLDIDVGTWTSVIPEHQRAKAAHARERYAGMTPEKQQLALSTVTTPDVMQRTLPGTLLRYEHHGNPAWTAVWRLTDVTIPHVNTFGPDYDDTWRLGLWPD